MRRVVLEIFFSRIHAKAFFVQEFFNRSKGSKMLAGIERFTILTKGNDVKLFFPGSKNIGLKSYFMGNLIFGKFFL